MTSTDPHEKWWERLIRALGGWGLAGWVVWALTVGKWPTDSPTMLVFAAGLIALGVGMAHSTVFGIWLNMANRYVGLDRLVAFFTRKGGERRNSGDENPPAGTRVQPITGAQIKDRRRRDK